MRMNSLPQLRQMNSAFILLAIVMVDSEERIFGILKSYQMVNGERQ